MGRRVVFFRPGVTDPMLASIGADVMALTSLVFDLLCADEVNQIKGVVYISDTRGVKMPHFTVFSPQYYFRVGKSAEVSLTRSEKNLSYCMFQSREPSLCVTKLSIL